MPADPKPKALADAKRAQAKFEKTQDLLEGDRKTRQASFQQAQQAGATLREIADAVGLHWTRVREIVSGR